MKKNRKATFPFGIAWYKPNQYARLLDLSENRESMHSNYLDWEKSALETIETLTKSGGSVEKILIDVEEALAWCKKRNIPFNGESRAEYAGTLLRQQFKKKITK